MFRNSFITLAVTGSFFSSCKTVDPPVQEVQTPASSSWSAPTTNGKVPESRAWLTDFATPELTSLVNQALTNNLNLQASAARIRAAQSVVIQRSALSLPRLGVGGEAARDDSRFSNPTSNFMLGPNIRWELDLWDRLSLQRDASSLDAEVLVNVDRGLRFSLAVAVVRNWCSLATNQLLLDLADETISNYLKTLQAVEDQVDGGIATVVEVNLARANLASSRAGRHWVERQQAQDLRALDVLLGRHPSGKQAAPRTLPQVSVVPAGLPSELLLRRPDLRAAQARLAAARLRREAAEKLNLPSLILSGNAGATSNQLSTLLNSRNLLWSMAAGLSQPIFFGGAIPAQKQQARAQQEEAAADWAQAVLQAFQEVETALSREGFINREIIALEAAATAAASAEQKTQRLYGEGLSSLTNLLVAQRRALDIRRNLIQTRRARIQNRLVLYLALGGGFE